MPDLSTRYLGLELANPIIVGSCGLTSSVDGVRRCADAGAGAVVLKSIFEEQITAQVDRLVDKSQASLWHPEAAAYIATYGKDRAVAKYIDLISEVKRAVAVPVIASVHCATAGAWTGFAKRIQDAGADGIELNAFVLPSDPRRSGEDNERFYFDVVEAVKNEVSLPLSIKLGFYFSSLVHTLVELSRTEVDGLVLFNRFYSPDFNIDKLKLVPAPIFSDPNEYVRTLRWVSILSGRTACDICATTGIHDGRSLIKQLLAGAEAVQIASTLYKNGHKQIGAMLDDLTEWMDRKEYSSIAEFKGKMAQAVSENPAEYLRVQFMKHSVGIE